MTVLAAIQLRQTEVQKLQAEELDALRTRTAELQKQLDNDRATREERMADWDRRIEKLVSGLGVFLAQIGKQTANTTCPVLLHGGYELTMLCAAATNGSRYREQT